MKDVKSRAMVRGAEAEVEEDRQEIILSHLIEFRTTAKEVKVTRKHKKGESEFFMVMEKTALQRHDFLRL